MNQNDYVDLTMIQNSEEGVLESKIIPYLRSLEAPVLKEYLIAVIDKTENYNIISEEKDNKCSNVHKFFSEFKPEYTKLYEEEKDDILTSDENIGREQYVESLDDQTDHNKKQISKKMDENND